jgi:predicted RecB family nuclease
VQRVGNSLRLSASDLVGHVDCHHLTVLDAAVSRGELKRPYFHDPLLETLLKRGLAHEREYVEFLKSQGRQVVEITGAGVDHSRAERTIEAMRAGADVIVQGAFLSGDWGGRTDILLRVEQPSDLGRWSYEVVDTKLARRTKGATILQLCVYSELVAARQGRIPEHMHVVTPGTGFALESYGTASYGAYFRSVRKGFETFLQTVDAESTYPEPNEHCDLCVWRLPCHTRRRADDHLCLVAGITKVQIGELRRRSIPTTAAFASTPLPLAWNPDRGAVQSYERAHEQARIQVEGRAAARILYETLPVQAEFGLCRLPAPSPGDMFFDLEGDPFVDEGGIEYLFGYAFSDAGEMHYRGEWAFSRVDEKRVFEQFVDFVMARWQAYPDLHIYHYAPYEPSALKRLMGRYATREDEIDRMLRAGLFIDLYHVVRHGIRASIERYSIKELEPLFAFTRRTALEDAGRALATMQALLETGDPDAVSQELRSTVQGYNRDDCLAAWALRDWLEGIRAGLIEKGESIPRPPATPPEPSEDRSAWQARIAALIARLAGDVPPDTKERMSGVNYIFRWRLSFLPVFGPHHWSHHRAV